MKPFTRALQAGLNRRNFIRGSVATVMATSTMKTAIASSLAAGRRSNDPEVALLRCAGITRPLVLDLAGTWHFKEDPTNTGEEKAWYKPGAVRGRVGEVPLAWELAFEDLHSFAGTGWYERSIRIPPQFHGKQVSLMSNGISDHARIWVNGQHAGDHDGALSTLIMDVTPFLRAGTDNVITIKAADPQGSMMDHQSIIRLSGLWQPIWLEATNRTFIADVFFIPDIDRSAAGVQVTAASSVPSGKTRHLSLRLVLTAPGGGESVHTFPLEFGAGVTVARAVTSIQLDDVQLWELEAPKLYAVQASLLEGTEILDEASLDFGMRKIEIKDEKFYLNGKPIYVIGGGLDTGPYGGPGDVNWAFPPPYHAPTDEEIRKDIASIKSLGVNLVRIPLRPAAPRFLYWADRMGLLVWQAGPWTPGSWEPEPVGSAKLEKIKKDWSNHVARDRNHPSVVVWELINEGGGLQKDVLFSTTAALYDMIKGLDPTRLVLDNSGGWALSETNYIGNHGRTDIEDVHAYPPFHQFHKARALFEDIRPRGTAVLHSEFGPAPYIYNVDKIRKIWGGKKPWWLEVAAGGYANMTPNVGFEERFYRWNLDKVYGDFSSFGEASDWLYYEGLKYQTELMRMNPELSGFVAWFSDIPPHPVGVVDFFKDKKPFFDDLAKIWTQDLVIVDLAGRSAAWEGETIGARVYASHFSDRGPLPARIRWWIEGTDVSGKFEAATLKAGEVKLLGEIEAAIPNVDQSRASRLYVEWQAGDGTPISRNYRDIYLFPRKQRTPQFPVISISGPLAWRFEVIGYRPQPFSTRVPLVATEIDADVLKLLDQGGTALVLACPDLLPGNPHLTERLTSPSIPQLLQKAGLDLADKTQGGHGDSFFIRKTGDLFARIPYKNPITWPFQDVWPRNVITGITSQYASDILAGAYGNFIRSQPFDSTGRPHKSELNATIAQFRYGKGRLIISTFNILESCADNPVATIMLNDLVAYANSAFQPAARLL